MYETRGFIAVFTPASHLSLTCCRSFQSSSVQLVYSRYSLLLSRILLCIPDGPFRSSSQNAACTRSVRKVSGHFEYIEYRSRGPGVTWQPVTGDLCASKYIEVLRRLRDTVRRKDSSCVGPVVTDSFITTTRPPILQLSCSVFFLFVFGQTSHHPDLSAPLQPRFGSLRLLALPKAEFAV